MDERLLGMLKMNDVEYKLNQDLSVLTSIKIGGIAELVILPDTVEKLISVAEYFRNKGSYFKIVGRMTNILPPDGKLLIPVVTTRRLLGFSVSDGVVSANAGESLARILRACAVQNLGGCEALSGIPGTLGGLVAMNAGAFGSMISDFFIDGLFYDMKSGEKTHLTKSDVRFSYRSSALRRGDLLLLSLRLKLSKKECAEVLSDIEGYREKRRLSQPTEPSLGSVFMRGEGIIPAKLIDECGLRGVTIGGAEVSAKHAGFIVNRGGATARDFQQLARYIKREVKLKFGVSLSREVEYL